MNEHPYISADAKIGENFEIGRFSIIEGGAEIGNNVKVGNFCVIKDGVSVGDDTVIKDYVELRENTIIGTECKIDSRVSTSGNCNIGNNVTLRYDSIIARGAKIGDNTYVCPRVMTNNLNTEYEQIGGADIGADCFIGTNAVLQHGITLERGVIVGAMAFVNKDCEADSTYIGIPAKKIK